jgi:hypothetical protein
LKGRAENLAKASFRPLAFDSPDRGSPLTTFAPREYLLATLTALGPPAWNRPSDDERISSTEAPSAR